MIKTITRWISRNSRSGSEKKISGTDGVQRYLPWANLIQSIALTAAILGGGLWSYFRFDVLLEKRIAESEAQRKEDDAVVARRQARERSLVSIDLAVRQLRSQNLGSVKLVVVELKLLNTGTRTLTLSAMKGTRFYIVRVASIAPSGAQTFADGRSLQFDYFDKTLTTFILEPSNESRVLRTVQTLAHPGLYLVRFSTPSGDAEQPIGAEYSAEQYILIE